MPASRALLNGWPIVAGLSSAPSALSISGASGSASVGDTATFTPRITGGTPPYTVFATGLPPGRSIANASTGLTTGTYTTAGSYAATYTVTDSVGATAGFTRTVTVAAALPTPVLLEAFDSLAGFTFGGSPQTGIDTARKVQGAGSLRLEGKGTGSAMTATKSLGSILLEADDVIVSYFDLEKPNIDVAAAYIQLERGGTYYGTQVFWNDQQGPSGGRWHARTVSEIGIPTGTAVTGIRARDDFKTAGGGSSLAPAIRHDAVYKTKPYPAKIAITLDDAMASAMANLLPLLRAEGIPVSHYVPWGLIGQSGKATLAQYQAAYGAGDDICLDGTRDDTPVTSRASKAAWLAELQEGDQWLVSNGWVRGRGHTTFPNGYKAGDASGVVPPLAVANCTTNGTTTLVLSAAPSRTIVAGESVFGWQVPAGTVVTDASNQTSLIVSAAIPTGTPKVTLVDERGEFAVGKTSEGLASIGFKTATGGVRGSGQDNILWTRWGIPMPFDLCRKTHTNLTWTQAQPEYDRAVAIGGTVIPLFHGVYPGASGLDTPLEFFTSGLIPWARPLVAAGKVQFVTLSQLYAQDGAATAPAA